MVGLVYENDLKRTVIILCVPYELGLVHRYTGNGIASSNPALSAILSTK